MNKPIQQQLADVGTRSDALFTRIEQLAFELDEKTFAAIEEDLVASLETLAIATELTDLAALEELVVSEITTDESQAPKEEFSLLGMLQDFFSGVPVISALISNETLATKDTPKAEGDCCVDEEEPCMNKTIAQPADTAQAAEKKKPLAQDPQITICIAPSTSEYFKDKTKTDPKDVNPTGNSRPAVHEHLNVAGASPEVEDEGGLCDVDENGAYTCIIVPSHKDLASSLLKGARRMLGFSEKALGNAEAKLPKKDDKDGSQ